MNYYDILTSHYGWQTLALIALIVALLAIQIYYYSFRLRSVGKYLNKGRRALHDTPPPVSLVVPMFSEDYDYLDDTLPLLLAQEAVTFEVVMVYIGSDGDFFDDMLRLKEIFPNVVVTKIERNERFPISVKTALNVGIKASHYEHIIFSTTDARPLSDKWLSLMARGFQRGDVVLGYCGVDAEDSKFDSYFIRASRMMDSMMWLSKAIHGEPYRAIRSNMGFTRSLYFGVNGFNRLNMNIGEDDLFMQTIMKDNNTSVILSPRATVLQKSWGKMHGWIDTQRYYGSATKFYPDSARNYVAWEMCSRVLFLLLCVVGIAVLPLELKALLLLLLLLRIPFVLSSIKEVSKRLGEKKMVGRYLLYDLLSPLFCLYMKIKMIKRDSRVWR
ncbi:MAG: glycosyltransferase [Rikenellaceae bacterium]